MHPLTTCRMPVPAALSGAAAVSCIIVAFIMMTQPMMSGGRQPSAAEALAMVALPMAASLAATWSTWRGRRALIVAATVVTGLFAFITGFSIGSAFGPAGLLLLWAVITSFDSKRTAG